MLNASQRIEIHFGCPPAPHFHVCNSKYPRLDLLIRKEENSNIYRLHDLKALSQRLWCRLVLNYSELSDLTEDVQSDPPVPRLTRLPATTPPTACTRQGC